MIRETLLATYMLTQVAPTAGSTSTSVPVSPSVMATVMGVISRDGRGEIELLVLWRGTPGWVLRNGGSGSSSGGGGAMGAPTGESTHSAWFSQGGVNLQLRFEPKSRKLWILDREVALNNDNVVLVDDVDSVTGAQVVRTLRIDPAFTPVTRQLPPGYPVRERLGPMTMMMPPPQEFIRRSPELVEFLRCDVVPSGLSAYEQQIFEMWCVAAKQP